MSVEIEAKLKVDSLEQVTAKLSELGAEFMAEQLQKDFYFDDKDRTFTKTDQCLRLRRELVGNSERFFLTYKGAKEKDQFKKRQEIDIEIEDPDSMEKMLIALGYKKALVFDKKRRTWCLEDCIIALDQLPLLGAFVEIEGPDSDKIENVQKTLGLANLPHINESYAFLIEQRLLELGKSEKEIFLSNSAHK
jgi:adenylate cyclase class 2